MLNWLSKKWANLRKTSDLRKLEEDLQRETILHRIEKMRFETDQLRAKREAFKSSGYKKTISHGSAISS